MSEETKNAILALLDGIFDDCKMERKYNMNLGGEEFFIMNAGSRTKLTISDEVIDDWGADRIIELLSSNENRGLLFPERSKDLALKDQELKEV